MKKFIYILIAAAVILTSSTGCRRMSHNGDIDGFWRVVSVEEIANGSTIQQNNTLYPDDIFYCINLELMQLQPLNSNYTGIMHFNKKEKQLTVEFPKQPEGAAPDAMHIFGIWTNPVTFEYSADSRHLVLRTPETVIKCDRF